jgi:hypothetical protein
MGSTNKTIERYYNQAPLDGSLEELQEWVDALPLLNTHKSAVMLYKALSAFDCDVPKEDSCERLNCFMTPIERITDSFVNDYVTESNFDFKIRQAQQFFARDLNLLLVELTHRLINKLINDGSKEHLACLCKINLVTFNKATVCGFYLSLPMHSDGWSQIYSTYDVMETNSLLDIPLEMDSSMSLGAVFKLSLLLSVSNPYQLNPVEIAVMYDICKNYASHAVITKETNGSSYSFDLNQNLPPAWLDYANSNDSHVHRRYFNVNPVISKLKENPTEMISTSSESSVILVKKLLSSWSHTFKRHNARNPLRGHEDITIISGLVSINGELIDKNTIDKSLDANDGLTVKGGKLPTTSTILPVQPFIAYIVNHYEKILIDWQLAEDSVSSQKEMTHWDVVDMSDGGLKIVRGAIVNQAVFSPGRLLGLRSESLDSGIWQVGVIRWIRVDMRHEVFMGIQLVSTDNIAVSIQNKQQISHGYELPGIASSNCYLSDEPQILITPAIPYRSNDTVLVTTQDGQYHARLIDCIDASRFHKVFTCFKVDE